MFTQALPLHQRQQSRILAISGEETSLLAGSFREFVAFGGREIGFGGLGGPFGFLLFALFGVGTCRLLRLS